LSGILISSYKRLSFFNYHRPSHRSPFWMHCSRTLI